MNQAQNNTKGIIFILIGMASFSIQDSLIKFIYNDTALYELYFVYAANAQSINSVKAENSRSYDLGVEKFFSNIV